MLPSIIDGKEVSHFNHRKMMILHRRVMPSGRVMSRYYIQECIEQNTETGRYREYFLLHIVWEKRNE